MDIPYDLIIFDWNGTLSTGVLSPDSSITPLFPGVAAMLKQLDNAGVFLAIATMAPKRYLQHQLEAHDIDRHFVAYSCGDSGFAKPHPGVIESVLQETGAEASKTLMVGDSASDVECARYAGVDMACVGEYEADNVVVHLKVVTDLLTWLQQGKFR